MTIKLAPKWRDLNVGIDCGTTIGCGEQSVVDRFMHIQLSLVSSPSYEGVYKGAAPSAGWLFVFFRLFFFLSEAFREDLVCVEWLESERRAQ